MSMGCAGAIKQGASFEDFVVRSAAVFVSEQGSKLAGMRSLDESPLGAELVEARVYLATLDAMTAEEAQAASDAEYATQCANRDAIQRDRALLRQRYEATLARLLAWNPDVPAFESLKASMVDDITKSIERDCCAYTAPVMQLTGFEWRIEKMFQQNRLISHLERRNNHFAVLQALRESLGIESGAPT